LRAIEAHKGVLTYEPFTRVLAVDPAARRVETEAGRLAFDFLSLIPPHRVVPFVAEADLGAPLVDVDPLTFRSATDERVYAVGDTADSPYARTAHTAVTAGRLAGGQIARVLGARVADVRAPQNVCYPMVSRDRALRLGQDWYFERDEAGVTQVKVAGTADNAATAGNLRLRREWQACQLAELIGRSDA
jgi:hypothetical protein